MASEGPLYPSTITSVLETGDDNAWLNPTNVDSDNGVEAQVTDATFDANDQTAALRCSNFGFAIPAGSTIDGIVVEVEQRRFAGGARDHQVQLFSAPGTLVGANKATATAWPTTAAVATYGGASDTWTASPTVAMVNSSNFGVQVKGFATGANTDIGIDFVRITIHYSAPVEDDRARVTWAEFEVPTAPRRAWVSWMELEVPTAPRRLRVTWAEFETPLPPRLARVTWAEVEVPTLNLDRLGLVSWAEFEIPNVPHSARVSWAEMEVPLAPRRLRVTWAEFALEASSGYPKGKVVAIVKVVGICEI